MKPDEGLEYVAHYSEADTRNSERAFVRRGFRELWLWETLLGMLSACLVLAIGYTVGAGRWFLAVFGALGFFLIAMPVFLLVTRPALAAAGARRRPSAVISFRSDGLHLRHEAHEHLYEWYRIRRIWDAGPHYVLVADRRLGIHLPKEGLPEGALEYVRSRAALSGPGRRAG